MEKKDIKQFLHLYLGCEVSVTNIEGRYTKIIDYDFFQSYYDEEGGEFLNDPKLILRPLTSMTNTEAINIIRVDAERIEIKKGGIKYVTCDTEFGYEYLFFTALHPDHFRYLLSKGFDLFGLIESGLAIDSTLKPV